MNKYPIAAGMFIAFVIFVILTFLKGVSANIHVVPSFMFILSTAFKIALIVWLGTILLRQLNVATALTLDLTAVFAYALIGAMVFLIVLLLIGQYGGNFTFWNALVAFGKHYAWWVVLGVVVGIIIASIINFLMGGVGLVTTLITGTNGYALFAGFLAVCLIVWYFGIRGGDSLSGSNGRNALDDETEQVSQNDIDTNNDADANKKADAEAKPDSTTIADNGAADDNGDDNGKVINRIKNGKVELKQETDADGNIRNSITTNSTDDNTEALEQPSHH